jgi:CRISPR-associated RAMP protein (TIGR02581 family)
MNAKLLDTFEGRLRLHGTLITGTALHIGAGGSGDALGTDSPVVRTAGGTPYIPGSSLKGVLRSATEALLRGGPFQREKTGYWACDILAGGENVCVSHERVEKLREEIAGRARKEKREPGRRELAEAVWAESCAVCKLFGSLALASRARFADLPVRGDVPLSEFRNGVGIDRDKELAATGVLYDFEVVPPETSFELRVTVDNPTDEEVGLLLYLFEELNAGNLTLGGKTSRGLGRVRVVWEEIEEISLERANPFADLLSSRDLLARAESPTQATAESLEGKLPTTGEPEAWRALADILRCLPKIDNSLLAEQAAKVSLNKTNLNEKLGLGLGLDEKKARKAWNVALDRLAASGFLTKTGEDYRLAGQDLDSEAASPPPDRSPALQAVFDRYASAMARVWQEAL